MRNYDVYGREIGPATKVELDRIAARTCVPRVGADLARDRRAWARLCGMASPIGRPSAR